MPADRALFLQGELERALYVLGAGALAIVRELVPGDPQELVVLAPGAIFGAGGFVASQPRSASAIARTDCWVLMLGREAADELPRAARRSLYEGVLSTLRAQLQTANDLIASRTTPAERSASLPRAAGHLQGWQPGDQSDDA